MGTIPLVNDLIIENKAELLKYFPVYAEVTLKRFEILCPEPFFFFFDQ